MFSLGSELKALLLMQQLTQLVLESRRKGSMRSVAYLESVHDQTHHYVCVEYITAVRLLLMPIYVIYMRIQLPLQIAWTHAKHVHAAREAATCTAEQEHTFASHAEPTSGIGMSAPQLPSGRPMPHHWQQQQQP